MSVERRREGGGALASGRFFVERERSNYLW
jgi:hypothetical protein